MPNTFDLNFSVRLAQLNIEESIEHHANLAQAQIQVEAHQAFWHIERIILEYKIQDVFNNRSRGQKRRYAQQKGSMK